MVKARFNWPESETRALPLPELTVNGEGDSRGAAVSACLVVDVC